MRLLSLPLALAAIASHINRFDIYPARPAFDDILITPFGGSYQPSRQWQGRTPKKRRNPNRAKQAAAKRARKITRRNRT